MQIARGLSVEDLGDGGVRVRFSDWPRARWIGAPVLLLGALLAVWSARTHHWVELGGATTFCAFGMACLRLAWAHVREFEIYSGHGGVSIAGFRGAGPWRRMVAQDLPTPARLVVRPFAVPQGAPDLPDRGGDLVLTGGGVQVLLARRVGSGWAQTLEAARVRVLARIPELG